MNEANAKRILKNWQSTPLGSAYIESGAEWLGRNRCSESRKGEIYQFRVGNIDLFSKSIDRRNYPNGCDVYSCDGSGHIVVKVGAWGPVAGNPEMVITTDMSTTPDETAAMVKDSKGNVIGVSVGYETMDKVSGLPIGVCTHSIANPEQIADGKHSHYKKDVSHLQTVDIYDVLDLFGVQSHPVGHAIKKLLMAGKRGAKGYTQDLQESIDSVQREIEMDKLK